MDSHKRKSIQLLQNLSVFLLQWLLKKSVHSATNLSLPPQMIFPIIKFERIFSSINVLSNLDLKQIIINNSNILKDFLLCEFIHVHSNLTWKQIIFHNNNICKGFLLCELICVFHNSFYFQTNYYNVDIFMEFWF